MFSRSPKSKDCSICIGYGRYKTFSKEKRKMVIKHCKHNAGHNSRRTKEGRQE